MQFIQGFEWRFLTLLTGTLLAAHTVPAIAADAYPNRPVRIVTPAAPGGTTDFLARLLANHLTKAWKQQVIVDNRGSASGVNGAQIVKESAPDGYTLFIPYHQHTVNAALIAKLPYHAVNDFTAITQMTAGGLLLVVNPSHPAKTAKDFVQWAKSTKEQVNFGSAGIGSGGHLAGELFQLMTSSKAQHIPYKGTGPAAVALIQGEYHYNFMGLTGAFAQVRSGKLRAIAVSGPKRVKAAPDIPAMAEVLPGFEVVGWYGITGPARMPKPLLTKIHAEISGYVKSPEFSKVAESNGSEAVTNSPEEFRNFMLADMKKWADVVKRAGIKGQ